jgi:hypothetical protein
VTGYPDDEVCKSGDCGGDIKAVSSIPKKANEIKPSKETNVFFAQVRLMILTILLSQVKREDEVKDPRRTRPRKIQATVGRIVLLFRGKDEGGKR